MSYAEQLGLGSAFIWLAPSVTGSPAECAAAVRHQFELGAADVILHGVTPQELGPLVKEYAASRR
ncbi:hypothetical protein [Pseudonocardia xishanensis]|uniref:Luciferase-like monooxygenase n=1 Tax=Pseudonocardia xishanensis TaxID=630995 RepID=A0ABP8RSL6_9PSEU